MYFGFCKICHTFTWGGNDHNGICVKCQTRAALVFFDIAASAFSNLENALNEKNIQKKFDYLQGSLYGFSWIAKDRKAVLMDYLFPAITIPEGWKTGISHAEQLCQYINTLIANLQNFIKDIQFLCLEKIKQEEGCKRSDIEKYILDKIQVSGKSIGTCPYSIDDSVRFVLEKAENERIIGKQLIGNAYRYYSNK
ncbi:hypothetical protein DWV16_18560 [Anaerotruncus sp. AF02-27]|uniref:hypothetical protein n=1 Tax=Anaerotruncus sp. AF02-27 TaxID=2292191 RepID=UPI000E4B4C60|nr:hypothetical protein [Anaerotruncus sp. AF02-27]RGX51504.1 hypothetical protein DWV16_18560 [Anaerotruncus sp. AF02-27]